jgi:pilus assembly protein Flp/PilA
MGRGLAEFAADESGATAIEYGLVAALIAMVIVGGVTAAGGSLSSTFEMVKDKVVAAMAQEP